MSTHSIRQLSSVVEETFAAQGIRIAERAVSLIDGDAFEALVKSMDIDDPFYEETRLKLFDLHQSSGSMYLFTMAPYMNIEDTWVFIIDGSAEPDDEEHFSDLGDPLEYEESFYLSYTLGITEASGLEYQEGWGWLVSVYTPIRNSSGKIVGIVGVDFDGTYLHESIRAKTIQQMLIGLLFIFLGVFISIIICQRMTSPIYQIANTLKDIGKGDLTHIIKIKSNNEIADMSNYFNQTIQNLKDLIAAIKFKVNALTNTSFELTSNMKKTSSAVEQISVNFKNMQTLEADQ
jgi:methyl-accepting chemotaxis protein